jgi:alternate signal-mediated exported protein
MRKGKRLLKTINQNKFFLALFSIFLSLLLIVGSTYSWITYSDEYVNQSKISKRELSAVLEGNFTSELQWKAGGAVESHLAVKNNGQMPAVVRIALYEFLAHFAVDLTDDSGNGNLKTVKKASSTNFLPQELSTWTKNNTYKIASDRYFVVEEVYKSNKNDSSTAYIYEGNRPFESLNYLTIHFNESVIYTDSRKPPAATKDYWYYKDGYFYYSEILQPKQKTKQLITSISLDANLPNKYKGSLYQLTPIMDAHDITKSLMTDWQIASNSYVETIYREKVH